jgi:hypothetical protein
MLALLAPLMNGIFGIVDKVVEDKDQAAAIKHSIATMGHDEFLAMLKSATSIITAEAKGSWLSSSWRPITMLVFLGMVVSWWFGYTPVNVTETLVLELFSLIKIGLGGYVVGRSVEKTAKTVVGYLKDKK